MVGTGLMATVKVSAHEVGLRERIIVGGEVWTRVPEGDGFNFRTEDGELTSVKLHEKVEKIVQLPTAGDLERGDICRQVGELNQWLLIGDQVVNGVQARPTKKVDSDRMQTDWYELSERPIILDRTTEVIVPEGNSN